jgi:hypothetical protein
VSKRHNNPHKVFRVDQNSLRADLRGRWLSS